MKNASQTTKSKKAVDTGVFWEEILWDSALVAPASPSYPFDWETKAGHDAPANNRLDWDWDEDWECAPYVRMQLETPPCCILLDSRKDTRSSKKKFKKANFLAFLLLRRRRQRS